MFCFICKKDPFNFLCLAEEHRISNSVFSSNFHQGINYTSVHDESNQRLLTIERCKIIDTDNSPSNLLKNSAISVDIQDGNFALANNFIAGNRLGGITVHFGRRSEGTSISKGFIYGNTFYSNANGTISVSQRQALNHNHSFVYIRENLFENNLGRGSTVKISDVQCEVINNFFYNNSGLHSIEYEFSSAWAKGQLCEQNTFYLNQGLGRNYGVTILSNGPMEYHRNNFKNPSNLYEFSATRQAVFDPIRAEMNWWGVGMEYVVGSRIHEKADDYRLASVKYIPFQKLPPKNILSSKCYLEN